MKRTTIFFVWRQLRQKDSAHRVLTRPGFKPTIPWLQPEPFLPITLQPTELHAYMKKWTHPRGLRWLPSTKPLGILWLEMQITDYYWKKIHNFWYIDEQSTMIAIYRALLETAKCCQLAHLVQQYLPTSRQYRLSIKMRISLILGSLVICVFFVVAFLKKKILWNWTVIQRHKWHTSRFGIICNSRMYGTSHMSWSITVTLTRQQHRFCTKLKYDINLQIIHIFHDSVPGLIFFVASEYDFLPYIKKSGCYLNKIGKIYFTKIKCNADPHMIYNVYCIILFQVWSRQ